MKLEFVRNNEKNRTVSFVLHDTTPAFANLLRRAILEDVPTLAIEYVTFHKNSSILYDEMIAHRLGLIPLTTDLSSYQLKGSDELSALNSVKFTLKAVGPCTVYAKELHSADPKIKPVYPEMPIVKLLEGQELDIEAVAILGAGREHAKWAPAHAHYHYQQKTKKADSAPAGVVVGSKVISDDTIPYSFEVEGAEQSFSDFVFTIESFGQLSTAEIISKAVSLTQEKLDELVKLI